MAHGSVCAPMLDWRIALEWPASMMQTLQALDPNPVDKGGGRHSRPIPKLGGQVGIGASPVAGRGHADVIRMAGRPDFDDEAVAWLAGDSQVEWAAQRVLPEHEQMNVIRAGRSHRLREIIRAADIRRGMRTVCDRYASDAGRQPQYCRDDRRTRYAQGSLIDSKHAPRP